MDSRKFVRVFLHGFILLFSLVVSSAFEVFLFLLPIFLVVFFAAARNKSEKFDVIDMFWFLFSLSFFVAPVASFEQTEGDWLFGRGVLVEYWTGSIFVYEQWVFFVFLLMIFVVAIVNYFILPSRETGCSTNYEIRKIGWVLILVVLVAFVLDIILRGGLGNVLAPRHERDQDSLSIFSIFSGSVFLASFWISTIFIRTIKTNLVRWFALFFTGFLALVLYNPFNSARFALIQAWLPFLLILFPGLQGVKLFIGLVAFGLVVLMPILSLTTRYGVGADIESANIGLMSFLDFFDQHLVAIHLVDMVDRVGFQLGSSLMSVVAFFVPRAIWSDKPLVIGLEVGEEMFFMRLVGTPNLSGPIFLDFYYDFGLVGVLLLSMLTAYLFRLLISRLGSVNGVPVFSFIVLSALPIVFRGSVGAVIGVVFFSLLFSYFIIRFCSEKTGGGT